MRKALLVVAGVLVVGAMVGWAQDAAKHVLSIKDGVATYCTCGDACKCTVGKEDPSKCSCGKAVATMSVVGKFVCAKCCVVADAAGKCSKCQGDLVEAKAKAAAAQTH